MNGPLSPRLVNLAFGVWLFVSTFLWPHAELQENNTRVIGILIAVNALLTFVLPDMRWMNAVLAVWLVLSAFVLPTAHSLTIWNAVFVGVIVFLAAITPGTGLTRRRERRTTS